ncbi:hypothetical protein GCM10009557_17730 [Virgisporangium ochraceum]
MQAERAVDVQRRAGRLRVLGDQFQVGERGQEREDERDEEAGPDGASRVGTDLAGERVDAGAEDVAEDEERQHRAADHAPQVGVLGFLNVPHGHGNLHRNRGDCPHTQPGANMNPLIG